MKRLEGIIPPLTTPFTESGDVYEEGLRRLVEFQIEKGVHGLFICGTYGSGPIMTVGERVQVHEIVVDQVKGRVTVVAHVGTTSTCMEVSGGPCRSRRIAQACMRSGTWPSGGISPMA